MILSPWRLGCSIALWAALLTVPLRAQEVSTDTGDLSPSKIREALVAEAARIASHPRDPANYVSRAYTLTDAGLGELAREAAAEGTEEAPQSSFAFNAKGWVLHHNLIGVDFGKGYDAQASIAAYEKAIALDPSDLELRQSFADTLEFNADGIRYAPDAHLSEAIQALKYIKAHQAPVAPSVEENLLIDLFYAGRYAEVAGEMLPPATPTRDGVALAALAASQGAAAAIAAANQAADDPQRRSAALNYAAEGLWNKQLYAQAADLLSAGLPEQGDASTTLRKIQLSGRSSHLTGLYCRLMTRELPCSGSLSLPFPARSQTSLRPLSLRTVFPPLRSPAHWSPGCGI